MALYWLTPGFKGRTFKLCVLTRWDFNFCVRSSPLRGTMNIPDSHPLVFYSDTAYPNTSHVMCPYHGQNLSEEQQALNEKGLTLSWMVAGKIVRVWAFLDFEKNLKLFLSPVGKLCTVGVFLSPVGKLYTVGVLLTNCHTCLHGSDISFCWFLDFNVPSTTRGYLSTINTVFNHALKNPLHQGEKPSVLVHWCFESNATGGYIRAESKLWSISQLILFVC